MYSSVTSLLSSLLRYYTYYHPARGKRQEDKMCSHFLQFSCFNWKTLFRITTKELTKTKRSASLYCQGPCPRTITLLDIKLTPDFENYTFTGHKRYPNDSLNIYNKGQFGDAFYSYSYLIFL